MTVLKLSSFPAAFRTNVRRPMDFRLKVARRPPARKASPSKPAPKASRDANVALIMAVMMSLVFAPVVGMHLFATFGPADLGAAKPVVEIAPAAEVVSRTVPTLPPG